MRAEWHLEYRYEESVVMETVRDDRSVGIYKMTNIANKDNMQGFGMLTDGWSGVFVNE